MLALFNVYLCDMSLFIIESNIGVYADDATLYECEARTLLLKHEFGWSSNKIETESLKVFECFWNNSFKANSTRSHVILTIDNMGKVNVGGNIISFEKNSW